jgi:hypothetical protein
MMNHPHAMPEVTGEGPTPSFNPADEGSIVATSVNAPAYGYHPAGHQEHDWGRQTGGSAPPSGVRQTPSTTTISFMFGVLGICFTPLFVSAIIAIIAGHLAQREIRRAAGQLGGKGQTQAGLIMGYLGLGLNFIGVVGYIIWTIVTTA